MTSTKPALLITTLAALWVFAFTASIEAQVYKSIDEDGNVDYTDNPCLVKKKTKTVIPAPTRIKTGSERAIAEPSPEERETEPAVAKDEKATAQEGTGREQETKGAIIVGGNISIETSASGYAVIRAKIKNTSDIPIDGLRLDVILFHVERRRAAELAIPFTGGKKAPGLLEPGKTGEIVYETSLTPEEIAGRRYRLVWNVYKLETVKKARKQEGR